ERARRPGQCRARARSAVFQGCRAAPGRLLCMVAGPVRSCLHPGMIPASRRPAGSPWPTARGEMRFEIVARCPTTGLRAGILHTAHGPVETPAFMPVGTQATVKGLLPSDLAPIRPQVILANAYHLALRPGAAMVARRGGVHRFMAWDGPMLTDSGGYQVFSLAARRQLDDRGVPS